MPIKKLELQDAENTINYSDLPKDHRVITVLWSGKSSEVREALAACNYKGLLWASDQLETAAHYYEGCFLELDVDIDPALEQEYVGGVEDLDGPEDVKNYQYGSMLMLCPEWTWWCFSGDYLKGHLLGLREIITGLKRISIVQIERN